ncbi:MAG TPA: hypothetical protein VKY57_14310 [Chitinispirillaceae bacterium]|nr:hypothetical protein [Chitinispirillaceae bacterium]
MKETIKAESSNFILESEFGIEYMEKNSGIDTDPDPDWGSELQKQVVFFRHIGILWKQRWILALKGRNMMVVARVRLSGF